MPELFVSGTMNWSFVPSGHVNAQAVWAGIWVSGTLANNVVASGNIQSGQCADYHLASGAAISVTKRVNPSFSGMANAPISCEIISGVRAVRVNYSGRVEIAKASVSGKMPAMGVCLASILSGMPVPITQFGLEQCLVGLVDYSGYVGCTVFVGRSGQVTVVSGSWSSGGFLSGDLGQIIGSVANSGGVIFNLGNLTVVSGGPLGYGLYNADAPPP